MHTHHVHSAKAKSSTHSNLHTHTYQSYITPLLLKIRPGFKSDVVDIDQGVVYVVGGIGVVLHWEVAVRHS